MYYNFSTYDSRQKFGHDHLGKQSYGKNKIIHQYKEKKKKRKKKKKKKNFEIDSFVDALFKKSKLGQAQPVNDFYRGRQDNAGPVKNQPLGLMEYSGYHKTFTRKGISPFPQKKHSGGPIGTGGSSQAFKTTGNFRRTGTLHGWSRPHKTKSNVEDNVIFNLQDMLHPLERSFVRQQNKIINLFNRIDKSF